MTQYVHPCKAGLVRIAKHGRRWRTLLGEQEMGRHDSAETALLAVRTWWPHARIPSSLRLWRELPEPRRLGRPRRARSAVPQSGPGVADGGVAKTTADHKSGNPQRTRAVEAGAAANSESHAYGQASPASRLAMSHHPTTRLGGRLPQFDARALGIGDPTEDAVLALLRSRLDFDAFGAQAIEQVGKIVDAEVDHVGRPAGRKIGGVVRKRRPHDVAGPRGILDEANAAPIFQLEPEMAGVPRRQCGWIPRLEEDSAQSDHLGHASVSRCRPSAHLPDAPE